MKKLTAVLLSLVMALSLAAPALAADAPGAYTVDGEPVPTLKAGDPIPMPFLPEASNDAVLGIIGGQDGPTSIVVGGPLGSFNLEDIDWSSMESFDWSSLEEQLNQQRDENKKALGGVPGQVGVMVNGEYIQFPDAAPETADGRTMAPVRALVEALGGEVDYRDGTVTCVIGDYAYDFELGGATVKVRPCDTGVDMPMGVLDMDCAPYLKDGRTYIPVRFIAQAAGYDVGWDSFYETAILLDREELAAKIDERFTILNKVQANKSVGLEEGKSYRADVKGSVTVTAFDTLNGSKTYKADLTGKQIFNTDAASASLSLKLSDNVLKELDQLMTSQFGDAYEEDAAMIRTVVEGLEDMEVILTKEGAGWFRSKALDELSGEDNVWLGFDLGAELGELAFAQAGDTTIGKVLAQVMPCESVIEWGSAMEMADMLDSLYGDGKFTTSGGTSTLTIGVDDLFDIYKDMELSAEDIAQAKAAFEEYNITMKVDEKGGATVTCVMETAAQAGVPGMKITMDVKQAAGNVTMNMSFHIANMGEMKLELTQTQQAANEKPMTQPPAGATVVDAPELLDF